MTSIGKTILSFIAIVLLSNNVHALNWGQDKNYPGALVESDEVYLSASVEHLTNGTKTVVFYISPKDKSKSCDRFSVDGPGIRSNVIFYLNSQAIKGDIWCNKHDDDSRYYTFFASTEGGKLFIEKLFKVETNFIEFKIGSLRLFLPVAGFTEVWNGISDDVL